MANGAIVRTVAAVGMIPMTVRTESPCGLRIRLGADEVIWVRGHRKEETHLAIMADLRFAFQLPRHLTDNNNNNNNALL